MKFSLILKLDQSGDLWELFKGGFIGWKVLRDKDIYLTYKTKVAMGMGSTEAVKETANEFDVTDILVWRAIKLMSDEV